ncbi:MAG TPA: inositol monophosphatase family protein [Vicinamibacterales bacterium]|nr:inositol monophosphatase family protein [Vicinamibacterales bacterium]
MALDPIYLATAIEAALAAGRIQRAYFRSHLTIEKKGPIDLVTAADLEVEREFRALVKQRFPSHVVLGEEGADRSAPPESGVCWIIDPVDGTTNFAHGLAIFCVSIALEVDGRTEVGVVFDPMAGELFTAERGQGAWLNGRRLAVTRSDALIDSLLVTGFPYSRRHGRREQVEIFAAFLEQARAVRRLGSAALDLAYVAAGRFDAFWEEGLHPWDIAAGALIVSEAGGLVTDYLGAPLALARGQIVASNGAVHPRVLEVIQRVAARQPSDGSF